jgi:hypothetical protein
LGFIESKPTLSQKAREGWGILSYDFNLLRLRNA